MSPEPPKLSSQLDARARALFPAPEHPNLLSRVNLALLERLPLPEPRRIKNRDGASDYLERFYLGGPPTMPDGSAPFDGFGQPREGVRWPEGETTRVLHRFRRSDEDRELHDHPWAWSWSVILVGGYREERRHWDGSEFVVRSRDVVAGQVNVILGSTYHRVDLLYPETWSLFVMGPRTGETWSFWDRETGEVTPHGEFLEKKRQQKSRTKDLHEPREHPLVQLCTCGHARHWHHGPRHQGPCSSPCGCGCFVAGALDTDAERLELVRSPDFSFGEKCGCGHSRGIHSDYVGRCRMMVSDDLQCRCDSFDPPDVEARP